jgi:catechol 2,3-dioxygenase-like lactoylglutathione lyase family enzyme
MEKIDHIALQVNDVRESVDWYVDNYGCGIIYCDDTWAMLQWDNIKLPLGSSIYLLILPSRCNTPPNGPKSSVSKAM